ncbi:unnamed protein product, partial [Polarella glacialis]
MVSVVRGVSAEELDGKVGSSMEWSTGRSAERIARQKRHRIVEDAVQEEEKKHPAKTSGHLNLEELVERQQSPDGRSHLLKIQMKASAQIIAYAKDPWRTKRGGTLAFYAKALKVQRGTWEVTLDLKGQGLAPRRLESILNDSFFDAVVSKLEFCQPNEDYCRYFHLDVSENELGFAGVRAVVDFLKRLHKVNPPICVWTLRAYRNRLGDEGASVIAELILAQPYPISELHLSHNHITGVGAASVVLSAGAAFDRYPFAMPPKYVRYSGLWVRLEQNDVLAPDALVTAMRATSLVEGGGNLRLEEALKTEKEWGPQRGPTWATSAEITPQAILYIFGMQVGRHITGQNAGSDFRESAAAKQAAREAVGRAKDLVLSMRAEIKNNNRGIRSGRGTRGGASKQRPDRQGDTAKTKSDNNNNNSKGPVSEQEQQHRQQQSADKKAATRVWAARRQPTEKSETFEDGEVEEANNKYYNNYNNNNNNNDDNNNNVNSSPAPPSAWTRPRP